MPDSSRALAAKIRGKNRQAVTLAREIRKAQRHNDTVQVASLTYRARVLNREIAALTAQMKG